MDISQEYLWPLIGVFLGWLLSTAAAGWKDRAERLTFLGRLLTRLLDVHGDLKTLLRTSKHLKGIASDWEEYERLRQRIYTLHFLSSSGQINDLPELISKMSGYLPLEAAKLQLLSHSLLKSKDLKLDASAKESTTYVRILSMHEVGLEQCERELGKIVNSLAWKHGAVTRIKLWLHQRKINKTLPENMAFLEKFSKETVGGIGKGV